MCPDGSIFIRYWLHPKKKYESNQLLFEIELVFKQHDGSSARIAYYHYGFPFRVAIAPNPGNQIIGEDDTEGAFVPPGSSFDVQIKCTLDAIEYLINNKTYNSMSTFHDRINNEIPTFESLEFNPHGTWPASSKRISEVYVTYSK